MTRLIPVLLVLAAACKQPPDHLAAAEALLREGKTERALAEYQASLEQDGRNAPALVGIGLLHVQGGRWQPAAAALSEAKGLGALDPSAWLALVHALVHQGRAADAQSEVADLVKAHPALEPALLLHAALAASDAEVAAAFERVEALRKTKVTDASAELLLCTVDLLVRRGDEAAASALLPQANAGKVADTTKAISLADTYRLVGKLDTAERLYEAVTRSAPEMVSAWVALAYLSATNGHFVATERALARLPPRVMDQPALKVARGRVLLARGQFEQGIPLVRNGLAALGDAYGPQTDTRLALAKALARTGQRDAAKQSLQALIAGDKGSTEVELFLAELQARDGETDAAAGTLEKLARDPATAPSALSMLSLLYGKLDRHDDSIAVCKRWIEQDPNGYAPLIALSRAYERKGDREQARQTLDSAVEKAPGQSPPVQARLDLYAAQGQPAEAEAFLREQLESHGGQADIQLVAGDFYASRAKLAEAEAAYRKAIDLQPANPQALLKLATLLRRDERHAEALKLVKLALDYRPDLRPALLEAAHLETLEGLYDDAIAHYEAAGEPDAGDLMTVNNLAFLYALGGRNLDRALEYAKRANTMAPDLPATSDTLGWVHYQRREYDAAAPLLEKAATALPKAADVQYHLGMLQIAQGQAVAGRKTLEHALALSRDFHGADEARKLLEDAGDTP